MDQGLYYLAVPYQGSDEQRAYRTEISLKATAEFLRQGIHLFAPIIYVNQIAKELNLPSTEERRKVIMPYLFDFLKISKGMILITLEGWQDSWGVQQELKFCQQNQIDVYKISSDQIYGNLKTILGPMDRVSKQFPCQIPQSNLV